jgi:hypothetical protein
MGFKALEKQQTKGESELGKETNVPNAERVKVLKMSNIFCMVFSLDTYCFAQMLRCYTVPKFDCRVKAISEIA